MITRTILSVAAASALTLSAAAALAQEGGRRLTTTLTGAAEAPRPGDPDGSGPAEIRINPGQRQLCFTLTASGIDPATAAHIHEAPPGVAGPIVVGLTRRPMAAARAASPSPANSRSRSSAGLATIMSTSTMRRSVQGPSAGS